MSDETKPAKKGRKRKLAAVDGPKKPTVISSDGPKKSLSPAKKKGKKRNPWSDSEGSDAEDSDRSDVDMETSFVNVAEREKAPRRAAGVSSVLSVVSFCLVFISDLLQLCTFEVNLCVSVLATLHVKHSTSLHFVVLLTAIQSCIRKYTKLTNQLVNASFRVQCYCSIFVTLYNMLSLDIIRIFLSSNYLTAKCRYENTIC